MPEPDLKAVLRQFQEITQGVRTSLDAADTAHFHAMQTRMARPDLVAQALGKVQTAASTLREALQHAQDRLDELTPTVE